MSASKIQRDALRAIEVSAHKTVVLWYGTTFLVSGGTKQIQRNTIQALVRQGLLKEVEGIKQTFGLVPLKKDFCNCSRFPHERGKSAMCRYYKAKGLDLSRPLTTV